MLVDADAVVAQRIGPLERVQVFVVKPVPHFRVIQGVGDGGPRSSMGLQVILRQVGIGHEVEKVELHRKSLGFGKRRESVMTAQNAQCVPCVEVYA